MKIQSLLFKLQDMVQYTVDLDLRTMKIMLGFISESLSPSEHKKHASHISLIEAYNTYQESIKKNLKRNGIGDKNDDTTNRTKNPK